MTRIIKAAELFEPIDIDLFGAVFRLRTPTRSAEEKSSAKHRELHEASERVDAENLSEDDSRKALMPLFFDLFDVLLEPADNGEKKTHAKTVVKKLYEEDKIGLTGIQALIDQIGQVRDEERRPT